MKKLMALVLTVMLMTVPFTLAASDLTAMTVEQLLALRSEIEAELLARGTVKSFTVPPGEYEVGVDLPAGQYTLSLKDPTTYLASVYTHLNMNDFRNGGYDRNYDMRSKGDAVVGKVTFYNGEILEIKYASIVFAPYTGIKFD